MASLFKAINGPCVRGKQVGATPYVCLEIIKDDKGWHMLMGKKNNYA